MSNKMTYFIFSDVHGEYDALQEALREAGYDSSNPRHKLVSAGDAFDRGPHSRKVYNFLRQNNAICVKGNHDEFFQEYLEKGMDGEFVLFNILHNGLGDTIHSFTGLDDRAFDYRTVDRARANVDPTVLPWLQSLPLYFETKHFIVCHAGLDPNVPHWQDTDKHYMLWDIKDSHVPVHSTEKIVVIGHHHAFRVKQNAEEVGLKSMDINNLMLRTAGRNGDIQSTVIKSYGNTDEHSPYCYGNKIAIDGCTNLTHKVNVIVVEDEPLEDEPEKVKEDIPTPPSYGDTISAVYTSTDGMTYANYYNQMATVGITAAEAMENFTYTVRR